MDKGRGRSLDNLWISGWVTGRMGECRDKIDADEDGCKPEKSQFCVTWAESEVLQSSQLGVRIGCIHVKSPT